MTAFGALLAMIHGIRKLCDEREEYTNNGLVSLIWFMGGLIIFVCGLLGEYVTRIYDDVKGRQRFIIDEFDENDLQNPAHRTIYSHLSRQLSDIHSRQSEYNDEIVSLYKEAYDKYCKD